MSSVAWSIGLLTMYGWYFLHYSILNADSNWPADAGLPRAEYQLPKTTPYLTTRCRVKVNYFEAHNICSITI